MDSITKTNGRYLDLRNWGPQWTHYVDLRYVDLRNLSSGIRPRRP